MSSSTFCLEIDVNRWRFADQVRPMLVRLFGVSAGVRSEPARELARIGEQAVAVERGCVDGSAWPGRGRVAGRAGGLFSSCGDEACWARGGGATDGVHVQADRGFKLAGVERRLGLLQEFVDPYTAWVAQGARSVASCGGGPASSSSSRFRILSTRLAVWLIVPFYYIIMAN